jgi:hypothetical protein
MDPKKFHHFYPHVQEEIVLLPLFFFSHSIFLIFNFFFPKDLLGLHVSILMATLFLNACLKFYDFLNSMISMIFSILSSQS